MTLAEKVAFLLVTQRQTLTVAESCTGGRLADLLTGVPGSSDFFKLGLIVYSNEAKHKLLKIPEELIRRHGAVSEPVAEAMARSARQILKTDFGMAVTGIAGPGGGTAHKPVGLVYIAVCTAQETLCVQCRFRGGRADIKNQSAHAALNMLLEFLDEP